MAATKLLIYWPISTKIDIWCTVTCPVQNPWNLKHRDEPLTLPTPSSQHVQQNAIAWLGHLSTDFKELWIWRNHLFGTKRFMIRNYCDKTRCPQTLRRITPPFLSILTNFHTEVHKTLSKIAKTGSKPQQNKITTAAIFVTSPCHKTPQVGHLSTDFDNVWYGDAEWVCPIKL